MYQMQHKDKQQADNIMMNRKLFYNIEIIQTFMTYALYGKLCQSKEATYSVNIKSE